MTNGHEHFARLSERYLAEPSVQQSTMMGFPCLRESGGFFAAVDRSGEHLVVKLPSERVRALVAAGKGLAFAPNGRVFRQWLAVPVGSVRRWPKLMDEARRFVAGGET